MKHYFIAYLPKQGWKFYMTSVKRGGPNAGDFETSPYKAQAMKFDSELAARKAITFMQHGKMWAQANDFQIYQ